MMAEAISLSMKIAITVMMISVLAVLPIGLMTGSEPLIVCGLVGLFVPAVFLVVAALVTIWVV